MSDLTLAFLGPLLVTQNGSPVTSFRSHKERALLVYLAEAADQPYPRSSLISLFWPEMSEEVARNNLSQTLGRLRRSLEGDGPHAQPIDAATIKATREQIQFTTGQHIQIDTRRFCASLADFPLATNGQTKEISNVEAALQLYRGEFLQGLSLSGCEEFEQWLLFKRAYYQRLAVQGLDRLANLYLDRGHYADAQVIAHRHLALEPWAESAHRHLMRALALNGQRSAALNHYEKCRQVLLAELGVAPEAETTALFEQIQRGELHDSKLHNSELHNRATVQEVILPAPSLPPALAHDWHEMPALPNFFGRSAELAQLQQWLVTHRCTLVAILGIGGQGKTALSAQLAPSIATHFDLVIWRSLLNAPPLEELLVTILPSLSGEPGNLPPTTLEPQLALFFTYLQQRRVLLVLDNLESILQADVAGHYQPGYEAYHQLLHGIVTRQHQGQLLLTSRERPQGVARWEEERPLVRVLALDGLDTASGQAILASRGLAASAGGVGALVAHYSGNPLALKLVAQTVKDLFGGDVAAFLATEMPIFDDIRAVLEQQFARLSPLEQEILVWLAIEREPIVIQTLRENLVQPGSLRALIEAVRALQRRSLVEQSAEGFLLQNVVLEFTTDILVEQLYRELATSAQDATPLIAQMTFNRYALLKATAKEYVRTSQIRLITQPLAARLVTDLGKSGIVARLNALLAALRNQATPVAGYAAGNLLNLLLHLGVDLCGYDFSRLPVRQAHLQGHWLPQVNFRAADLTHSVFTHVFGLILAIRYDAAGQLWLAGVRADRLGVWRAAAGQFLEDYHEYGTGSMVCVFSPDLANGQAGRLLLASGSVDRKVRLWNVRESNVQGTMERGRLLHTIDHLNTPWSLAFSPDGKLLAGGTGDGAIAIWEVQSGRLLQNHLLRAHGAAITALAFSPDGQQLASGDVDGVIYLWQTHAPEPRYALEGHEKEVHVLLFDSTGERLISGSYDHSIRLWDLQQHAGNDRLLQTLREHTRFIRALALSPDGRTLASGGYDTFICLWDIIPKSPKSSQGGEPGALLQLRQRLRQAGPAHWLTFDPTTSGFAQRLAIVGIDLTVSIWDTQRGQPVETLQVYKDHLASMAISHDGRWLAGGSMDGIIRLWDSMDEQNRVQHFRPETESDIVGTANRNTRWIRTLAFCPPRFTSDGAAMVILASGGSDQTIRLWDLSTGRQLAALLGHGDDVDCIHFSPHTGNRLVSSSRDQTVRLWDVHVAPDSATLSTRLLDTFYDHTNHVVTCAFSPDERLVASGSLDRTVRLWTVGEAGSGQLLHTLVGHKSGVRCVLFSPDGRRVVSSSYDQSVIVWDVEGGCVLFMFMEETTVLSMAFHPDGNLLALGLNNFTVCLYDVQRRKVLTRLSGHNSTVESVHFSPNGQWLASASEDGVIKRWEVAAALAGRDACLQTLQVDRPYAGMQIAGVIGISAAQRVALQALGAVEDDKETRRPGEGVTSDTVTSTSSAIVSPPHLVTSPPHNLPTHLTPFVGRTEELAAIRQQLADPNTRLLTLIGVGGMGKTRLAVETAQGILDFGFTILPGQALDSGTPTVNLKSPIQNPKFPDGLFFVALAPITQVSELAISVAAAVGLNLTGGDPQQMVLRFLHDKCLFLILDNFEHLLAPNTTAPNTTTADSREGSAARWVAELLQAAPALKILVTSREKLNLQGEQIYPIHGLDMAQTTTLAAAEASTAVRLFIQSAHRVHPSFALTIQNLPALLRICQVVEGMPLGLELAAAWVTMLTLDEIAGEIEKSLDFLEVDWPEMPNRQRSMRGVFEWSWRLLSDPERQLLRQLAVFRGGFTRSAAEEIAGATLRRLTSLVQKSLVRRTLDGDGASSGRYELHELLRQFANEQLANQPVEQVAVNDRHSVFYLAFVATRERRLARNEPKEAALEIQGELDNVRQAWLWATQHDAFSVLDGAAYALRLFYTFTSLEPEGEQFFQGTIVRLRSLSSVQSQGLRSKLLGFQAILQIAQLKHAEAKVAAQEAIAVSKALPAEQRNREGETFGSLALGMVLALQSSSQEARTLLEQAIQLAQQHQSTATAGQAPIESLYDAEWVARISLRDLERFADNYPAAVAHIQQAVQLCRALGKLRGEMVCLAHLAEPLITLHEYAAARQACTQGLALARTLNNRWGEAFSLLHLGNATRLLGHYGEALVLLDRAYTIIHADSDLGQEAMVAGLLGHLYNLLGASEQAHDWFERFLGLLQQFHEPWDTAELAGVLPLALYYQQRGDNEQALHHARRGWQIAQNYGWRQSQAQALLICGHAQAGLQQLAAAAASYQQALALFQALNDTQLVVEPHASLARLALDQNDLTAAQSQVEAILPILDRYPQAGLDEPFAIYLTCSCVLAAVGDGRAGLLLQRGNALLQTYASQIEDDRLRRSFLERVPVHQALHEAAHRIEE